MIPTVEEVIHAAAFHLGDEPMKRFKATKLATAAALAFQETVTEMVNCGLNEVELKTLYILPANTPSLLPATALVTNLGALIRLRERTSGSATEFMEMDPVDVIPVIAPGGGRLAFYHWSGGQFHFPSIGSAVELEFTYYASGNLPDSGSTGLDNSLVVLSKLTAAYAGPGNGLEQRAAALRREVAGGDMQGFIQPLLVAQHNQRIQRGSYRGGNRTRSAGNFRPY